MNFIPAAARRKLPAKTSSSAFFKAASVEVLSSRVLGLPQVAFFEEEGRDDAEEEKEEEEEEEEEKEARISSCTLRRFINWPMLTDMPRPRDVHLCFESSLGTSPQAHGDDGVTSFFKDVPLFSDVPRSCQDL